MSTRIAPSPTGMFHIGTARTALFNYLYAKATGTHFILRIDDTDTNRNDNKFVDVILDTMDKLKLQYDQLHYQSKRLTIYQDIANKLVSDGYAINVNDAILINQDMLDNNILSSITFTDMISGINKSVINAQSICNANSDLVLLRSDGMPTYNFATAVDDIDMGITAIIRGVDHISNTPKQLYLHRLIRKYKVNANDIKFYHLGLLCDINGKKISKRDNTANMQYYFDNYNVDAILNWLLRYGWSPTQDDKSNKYINMQKAIDMFLTMGKMKNNPIKIDVNKLIDFNKHYNKI